MILLGVCHDESIRKSLVERCLVEVVVLNEDGLCYLFCLYHLCDLFDLVRTADFDGRVRGSLEVVECSSSWVAVGNLLLFFNHNYII
jgi:hypothetical protein